MRVVVAPDSFKGTLSAREAGEAIRDGWLSARRGDDVVLAPMADGGEGTLDAFEAAVPAARREPIIVVGPDDAPVFAHWLRLPPTARLPGGTGVVELAATSGITLMRSGLRPFDAHSFGLGQAITSAVTLGVSRLLIAVGGSASTDGGVGALTAMGARLTDAGGTPVPYGNVGLGRIAHVSFDELVPLPPDGAIVLTDVNNPLLGANGAAAVFGPQKGAASPAAVRALEANLAHFAAVLDADGRAGRTAVRRTDVRPAQADPSDAAEPARVAEQGVGALAATPGAGAAGGTAFGLLAWGATISPGAPAVADALGLADAIAAADLVITGEGRFDGQSEAGKAPSHVATLARAAGVQVALVAGAIEASVTSFASSASLTQLAGSTEAALAEPAHWARVAGAALARAT